MIELIVKLPLDFGEQELRAAVCRALGRELPPETELRIVRRAPETGEGVCWKLWVSLSLGERDERWLCRKLPEVRPARELTYILPENRLKSRPVVVGSGPAGLFAALVLAEAGAAPLLLERGGSVEERTAAVGRFFTGGALEENTNVQFGEGGAGTFSDGKLKAGRLDRVKYKILCEFVRAGAPEEILTRADAHIGTDLLPAVVRRLRERIVALGGEVRFHTRVTDLMLERGALHGLQTEQGELCADRVILATGHSARDVFSMLEHRGAVLEAKNFGVGVRVEHPQALIDRLIYGRFAGHPSLGAAPYHLVTHLPDGRSVYSFCMCPGGSVVAAASEEGGLVTNGMSAFSRAGRNANAALLVSVGPGDFGGSGPLSGVALQRRLERAAYSAGGGGFRAPGQRMEDFCAVRPSDAWGEVEPSYPRGCQPGSLDDCLPHFLTDALRRAIADFEAWLPGYYLPDAWLTGVETRSTSPVRVLRDDKLEAVGISGLYPCGEGAGYAGGILSAAADGILCAERVLGAQTGEGSLC